jgi:hypothetical protein
VNATARRFSRACLFLIADAFVDVPVYTFRQPPNASPTIESLSSALAILTGAIIAFAILRALAIYALRAVGKHENGVYLVSASRKMTRVPFSSASGYKQCCLSNFTVHT